MRHAVLLALPLLLLAACRPEAVNDDRPAAEAPAASADAAPATPPALPPPDLATPSTVAPPPAAAAVDPWLGTWFGPEGTFLDIGRSGDHYTLVVQSLDGPASYPATEEGGTLRFTRDGKAEVLRRTSGRETGMKWLLERKDCVTIKAGEGFCRDTAG